MPEIQYKTIDGVNELQTNIMVFVDFWVHKQKTPVPQSEIIIEMKSKGVADYTTINALSILLRKGFLRKAIMITERNKTRYIQLRTV